MAIGLARGDEQRVGRRAVGGPKLSRSVRQTRASELSERPLEQTRRETSRDARESSRTGSAALLAWCSASDEPLSSVAKGRGAPEAGSLHVIWAAFTR